MADSLGFEGSCENCMGHSKRKMDEGRSPRLGGARKRDAMVYPYCPCPILFILKNR